MENYMSVKYNVVSPLAEKDINAYYRGLDNLEKYLDVKKFVVIGNDRVRIKIKEHDDNRVQFVDENQFVSYSEIKSIIQRVSNNDEKCMRRTGWYLQQFLKFSYSLICDDEYYLLWDADTMPIHRHDMFNGDRIFFDMKTEHHKPYYDTFSKIFPQYGRRNELSYISEHMIVKTTIMRKLIDEIKELNISGETWYEKILNAVDINDLAESGFADYETYGLYCLNKYPDLYVERKWDSLRPASSFFKYEKMRDCDYKWLLKDYDAVSFEASRKVKRIINIICRSSYIQKKYSCKKLLEKLHQFTI